LGLGFGFELGFGFGFGCWGLGFGDWGEDCIGGDPCHPVAQVKKKQR